MVLTGNALLPLCRSDWQAIGLADDELEVREAVLLALEHLALLTAESQGYAHRHAEVLVCMGGK